MTAIPIPALGSVWVCQRGSSEYIGRKVRVVGLTEGGNARAPIVSVHMRSEATDRLSVARLRGFLSRYDPVDMWHQEPHAPGATTKQCDWYNAEGFACRHDKGHSGPHWTPGHDSPDGFDRAPDRYTRHESGRETIDRMRDRCHRLADMYGRRFRPRLDRNYEPDYGHIADIIFACHCDLTALKYQDRDGSDRDRNKRAWYLAMAAHVTDPTNPDPRHNRPGFVPYKRPIQED